MTPRRVAVLLALLSAGCGPAPVDDLRDGLRALHLGDADAAVRAADRARATRPAAAWTLRGRALALKGDWPAAEAAFREAFKADSGDAEARRAFMRAAFDLRRDSDAARAADDAARSAGEAGRYEAFCTQAEARLRRAEPDLALRASESALGVRADGAEALRLRARAHLLRGDVRAAEADCDRALALLPRDPATLRVRASAFEARGEGLTFGLADLTTAVTRAPDDAANYRARAGLQLRIGSVDEARADAGRAVRLAPEDALSWVCRGDVYRKAGDWPAAVADYEEATRRGPRVPEGFARLAWLLATCPDDGVRDGLSAVRLAARAVELTDERDAGALLARSAAAAETGDFADAVRSAEAAGRLPGSGGVREALLAAYRERKPWREP